MYQFGLLVLQWRFPPFTRFLTVTRKAQASAKIDLTNISAIGSRSCPLIGGPYVQNLLGPLDRAAGPTNSRSAKARTTPLPRLLGQVFR